MYSRMDHAKFETVVQRGSIIKVLLKISQKSQENTCARVWNILKQLVGSSRQIVWVCLTILRPATLFKKGTLAPVFSCEFCGISRKTFLHRIPLMAAFAKFAKDSFQKFDVYDAVIWSDYLKWSFNKIILLQIY